MNWSPVLETAVSDLEVKYEDVEGELVSFRYGSLRDDEPHIVVATTRVETMLGDTAIAVHPDDERYRDLVGKTLPHPFVDRELVIVADAHVDPEFGTGAVKVTPAHDPNDFEIGMRHQLPMPTIMDTKGRIADTGTEFDGLDRFEARVEGAGGVGPAGPSRRREAAVPAQRRTLRAQRRTRSNPGCRCSGGSRSNRWRRRQGTRCATTAP